MGQKVTINATEEEYVFQISEAKKLAKEYEDAVPIHIKERMKEKIRYMADLCLQMSVPKHKVISKIYADLGGDEDSFYKLRHIYNILNDEEYQSDFAILQKEDSSKAPNKFEIENSEMMDFTDKVIAFHQNFRKKLSDNHYISLVKEALLKAHIKNINSMIDVERVMDEDMYVANNAVDTANEKIDDRHSCIIVEHDRLIKLIGINGPSFAADEWPRDKTMTAKQLTNYRLGQVRVLHPLYDPHDEEDAINSPSKFYGVRCEYLLCLDCKENDPDPKKELIRGNKLTATKCAWCGGNRLVRDGCRNWRVKMGTQADEIYQVHCYACQADFKPTTRPLPTTTTSVQLNVVTLQAPNMTASVNTQW